MPTQFRKIWIVLLLILILTFSPNGNPGSIPQANANTNTILFSGYEWYVKNSGGALWGPGPNYFNDSLSNIWIDTNGSLHLRISHGLCLDQWHCAEIYSVESFGYGTYQFALAPGFENLDKNVVLGLFMYLDDLNEIDVEFAKWGQNTTENSQYVLQPGIPSHIKRFSFDPLGEESVHGFTWCKNIINFWSIAESNEFRWTYYGTGIPKPSTEHVNMNLWLIQGLAPSDYLETEVVIKSFEFTPSECANSPIGFWWVISFSIVGFLGIISTVIVFIIRKKKKNRCNLFARHEAIGKKQG